MKLLPSPYIHLHGIADFIDGDSEELYKINLVKQSAYWKYRHKSIKYHINSQFYRGKEFEQIDWNNSVVIFGCSTVFGVGIDESETISSQLTKLTGIPSVNLGYPGSSCQISLYNSTILKENNIKPRAVVFGWTAASRCTLFMDKEKTKNDFYIINCGNWDDDISGLGRSWSKYTSNIKIHFQMTRLVAKNLWVNTNYLDYTLFSDIKKYAPDCKYISQKDYARDLSHPGKKTYEQVSKYIAKSLNL